MNPPKEERKIVMPENEYGFRFSVLQSLARLETKMEDLLGNGQPGRIRNLERKVRVHDRILWIGFGAALVIGWLAKGVLAWFAK